MCGSDRRCSTWDIAARWVWLYAFGTCPHRRILIDTGEASRPDYVELLQSTLRGLAATVHMILITHWHHDHIGGLDGVYGLFAGKELVDKTRAGRGGGLTHFSVSQFNVAYSAGHVHAHRIAPHP